jgi:hypothetical protein
VAAVALRRESVLAQALQTQNLLIEASEGFAVLFLEAPPVSGL